MKNNIYKKEIKVSQLLNLILIKIGTINLQKSMRDQSKYFKKKNRTKGKNYKRKKDKLMKKFKGKIILLLN